MDAMPEVGVMDASGQVIETFFGAVSVGKHVGVGALYGNLTAVAVNGVLVSHQRGMKTRLADGDVVAFVKAAAGG